MTHALTSHGQAPEAAARPGAREGAWKDGTGNGERAVRRSRLEVYAMHVRKTRILVNSVSLVRYCSRLTSATATSPTTWRLAALTLSIVS